LSPSYVEVFPLFKNHYFLLENRTKLASQVARVAFARVVNALLKSKPITPPLLPQMGIAQPKAIIHRNNNNTKRRISVQFMTITLT
jgi:hypothetical protein